MSRDKMHILKFSFLNVMFGVGEGEVKGRRAVSKPNRFMRPLISVSCTFSSQGTFLASTYPSLHNLFWWAGEVSGYQQSSSFFHCLEFVFRKLPRKGPCFSVFLTWRSSLMMKSHQWNGSRSNEFTEDYVPEKYVCLLSVSSSFSPGRIQRILRPWRMVETPWEEVGKRKAAVDH